MMAQLKSFARRNNMTICVAVILMAFMAILYLQSLAMSKLQAQVSGQQEIINQVKGITDQINNSSKQRTHQINSLNHHLDCIVLFFSQSDRSRKAIDDIETCQLKDVSAIGPSTPKLSVAPLMEPVANVSVEPQTGTSHNNDIRMFAPAREDGSASSFLELTWNPINNLIKRLQGVQ